MHKPVVWTIAGLDPSGGAGIQTDVQTINSLGAHACSITTAIAVQNNQSVTSIEFISPEIVMAQITTIEKQFSPQAIKLGMLGNIHLIEKLIPFIANFSGQTILDPVLSSSSGYALIQQNMHDTIYTLKKLLPFISLLTPNLDETKLLLNKNIITHEDMMNAGNDLLSLGVKNVLIKGGHFTQNDFCEDYWTNGAESFWLTSKRYSFANIRGTGCSLSSAIASCLALGYDIKDALVIGKMYITQGIRLAYKMNYAYHLNQKTWPETQEDLPWVSATPIKSIPKVFPACAKPGLYPIVDNIEWLEKLLPLGVNTIQLRIKNQTPAQLENSIKCATTLARHYSAHLFINDYWELAIRYGAYGVHLGQDDILTADIEKIYQSGLRLGISTHCYYEVARAYTLQPSYLACGPIYPTTSKIMPFSPQGIHQLQRWRRTLHYPLVAIGGINKGRLSEILQTQVDGVAMISAITQAEDPISVTKELLVILSEMNLPGDPSSLCSPG